jgi:hypothetical protein
VLTGQQVKELQRVGDGLEVGSVWSGRGVRVRIMRVSLTVVWIKRLDLPDELGRLFTVHRWGLECMKGMAHVGG